MHYALPTAGVEPTQHGGPPNPPRDTAVSFWRRHRSGRRCLAMALQPPTPLWYYGNEVVDYCNEVVDYCNEVVEATLAGTYGPGQGTLIGKAATVRLGSRQNRIGPSDWI